MKVLAIFDADDTLWDIGEAIWDSRVERRDGDTLHLAGGKTLRLRPEVRPGLLALKERGVLTALASHNLDLPDAGVRAALDALGLTGSFDLTVVRDSSDKNSMISDICAELGVDSARDAVFFTDDSERHVINAGKIGVRAQMARASIRPFFDAVLEAAGA